MAIHNTPSDASNTAVRAYLTAVGQKYLGYGFNTGSGKGKDIWVKIKKSFRECCAYCGACPPKLTIEHLVSFNRDHGGLHHPGNIVPCCSSCNRRRKEDGQEVIWETHLEDVAKREGFSLEEFSKRKKRIQDHITEYKYPKLSDDEIAAIITIARSLYEEVSSKVRAGTELFWAIDSALIKKKKIT
jgi:hypothetical protein